MTLTIKGDNMPSLASTLGVQASRSHFTLIKGGKALKQDAEVLSATDIEKDDAFEEYYFDPTKAQDDTVILRPPHNPKHLSMLIQRNNTLGQLIAAMETNVDGTGWVIEKRDQTEIEGDDEDKAKMDLEDFFDEVYPAKSFTTVRRGLRRDLEKTGFGFLEVLRSVAGDVVFLKHIPSDQMRMVKLDEAVAVTKTVLRKGTESEIVMNMRERRFAQVQGKKIVFFKAYGASRELDRNTGEWSDKQLDATDRATEVLFFTVSEDAITPYGVPRWINQVPSVLGSRAAEELNLDFFNSGGLPPALIFIQGGELTEEVRKQLQQYLTGKGASINRAGIVEVAASSGTLDSPGSVRVSVERFGSERMSDSMFENYDQRCEERVRASFRLPPILIGKSQDYSFATAFASYTVAEAQVFKPEREEFDEVINNTIMRELDPDREYKFRSLPLTVHDVSTQLEALGLVGEKITSETLIEAVNELTGMALKIPDEDDEEQVIPAPNPQVGAADNPFNPNQQPVGAEPTAPGTPQPANPPAPQAVAAMEKMDSFDLMEMVNIYCAYHLTGEGDPSEVELIRSTVSRMDPDTRARFDGYCTMRMMNAMDHDMVGAVELMSAAIDMHEHGDADFD